MRRPGSPTRVIPRQPIRGIVGVYQSSPGPAAALALAFLSRAVLLLATVRRLAAA